jgi:hypothetical protein
MIRKKLFEGAKRLSFFFLAIECVAGRKTLNFALGQAKAE